MTDALAVRPAVIGDLLDIVDLRLALLREYGNDPLYMRLRSDARERAQELFLSQLASPDETMLLAVRGRRIVGIFRCVDSLGSPLLEPERYCYVSSVYVLPSERRRGVLRALLTAAERWCSDRGIDEMRLHSASSSSLAADVWSAFGFEVVEHVRRRAIGTKHNGRAESPAHAGAR